MRYLPASIKNFFPKNWILSGNAYLSAKTIKNIYKILARYCIMYNWGF